MNERKMGEVERREKTRRARDRDGLSGLSDPDPDKIKVIISTDLKKPKLLVDSIRPYHTMTKSRHKYLAYMDIVCQMPTTSLTIAGN